MKNLVAILVITVMAAFIVYAGFETYKVSFSQGSSIQRASEDYGSTETIEKLADYYFNQGLQYSWGQSGKEVDHGESTKWYLRSAGLGDHRAQYNLGNLYVKRGQVLIGLYWLEKSFENGSTAAGFLLGSVHNKQLNNFYRASEIWQKAAELGSFESKVRLANEYEARGKLEKAKFWYQEIVAISFEKHVELDRTLRFTPENYRVKMEKEYQNSVDYLSVLDGDTGNIDEMLSDFE